MTHPTRKEALESAFPKLLWNSVDPLREILTEHDPKLDTLTRLAVDRK